MKIGFIGAGKVGFSLGKYFSQNGKFVTGYYSKSDKSSIEASTFTKSKNYSNIQNLINDSDFIFITTPDDEIIKIWHKISSLDLKDKIICHTSGSISSKIFYDINNSGASGYSIHPMFPFSDKYTCYKKLNTACFSIEGNKKHIHRIINFFSSIGNKTYIIETDKKTLYHLGNVTVSNLVLALLKMGNDYLVKCGFNSKEALNALMPLITMNITNIKNKGFKNSLTGPIERNDIGTIEHHINVIPKKDKEIYKFLSLKLLDLSESKHEDRNYSTLKNYLRGKSIEKYNKHF